MTPQLLRMALAYYCSPEPEQFYTKAQWDREGNVREALCANGLLETVCEYDPAFPRYEATDRLNAYVNHILGQPLPVQKWVVPQEEA